MRVEYINPFISATQKVLHTMAFTESKAGKPFLKDVDSRRGLGDISAVIELTGEGRGSIALSFKKDSILAIAKQMFGDDFTDINHEVVDMVGELVNMVSGETRRELAKRGFRFAAGIPVTSNGNNHEILHFVQGRIIVIPFKTPGGEYFIEACFESNKITG